MTDLKERAPRNRTLSLNQEETNYYLSKCLSLDSTVTKEVIIDRIIYGNCFDILPKLPPEFVDLLIVDPPYNLSKHFGSSKFNRMDNSDYEKFTRAWIEASIPTLKKSASIYVCCDWRTSLVIGTVLEEYFTIQNRITWQREKGRGALRNWKNSMEDIWFVTLSNKYIFNIENVKQRRKVIAPYRVDGKPKDWKETEGGNFRDTYPSNFWNDISIPFWSMPENTDHPTQKPEKLYAKLTLASSNAGDIILDPFLGVGTSSVVAKKLGRHFVGIEKEAEYCALSQKRLELADSNRSIQGYSDNVFWDRNTLADQMSASKKNDDKNDKLAR